MNTILTINLTGSVLMVLYFLVKHFLEERLTKKFLYRILQVNVVCFLVPLMVVGEIYRGIWWDLKVLLMNNRDRNAQVTPKTPMFLQIEQKINFSIGMKGKMILIGSYLFLVILCFVISIIRDRMRKKSILSAIKISGISEAPDLLELQKKLKVRKKVKMCLCRDASQIATIGMFHPIIFFKDPEDDDARKMILSHELYHIKGHDVLWRWIVTLANCIHFYNPLVYLLRWELKQMQELRCDEQVISILDADSRGKYANLLLENSREKSGSLRFSTFFGEPSSFIKLQERIKCIMKNGMKKKLSKRLAAALTAVVLGTTSLTALAYDDMSWWHKDGDRTDAWETGRSEEVNKVKAYVYDDCGEEYPVIYEKEYIDEEGNIYALNEEASPTVFCIFHSYQNLKVVEHYLLNNGGCEVWFYDAVMCEKCHYTKTKELTAIDRFDVCPHDLD